MASDILLDVFRPDKNWDVFEETAWENLAHADRRFWARVNAVSRVVLCLFLFLLITFASCLSTMVFLVIGYNINSAGQNFTLPGGQVLKLASDVVNVRWVWAAIMMTTAPYFFTLVSCLFKLCVKRTRDLMIKPLLTALAVETVHSIGLGVFVFLVAPAYDPLMVILLGQGVALVPALLRIYRVKRSKQENQSFEDIRWSWLNFSACVLTLVFLGLVAFRLYEDDIVLPVAIPVSLALLSVEWWENFVPVKDAWKRLRRRENREMRKFKRTRSMAGRVEQKTFEAGSFLFRAKYAIRERRTKIEAVCMVWKIFLNLVIPMAIFASNGSTDCVSALYFTADSAHDCSLWGDGLDSSGSGWCDSYLPFVVAAVGIGASGLAYKAAKVACKIHAQRMCFALPFLLSAPLTFIMALVTYRDPFIISDCPQLQWPLLAEDKGLLWLLDDYTRGYWLPLIFVGLLLVGFTSNHVWTPSAERVASTDKLFVRPLYCGVMFVQSMLLNRAVDDTETGQSRERERERERERAARVGVGKDPEVMAEENMK
nr:hypothetical protein BaRGS_000409 [Batillaria attramentaria]